MDRLLRINPGTYGWLIKNKRSNQGCKNNNRAIRVGVNAGSLEKDILENIKSLVRGSCWKCYKKYRILENEDFNLKVSVKSSMYFFIGAMTIVRKQIILHIGITEEFFARKP